MIDTGNDTEGRSAKESLKTGAIIDATAQRRPRIYKPETKRRTGAADLVFLEDVPLKVNVVLAETTMPLGEILALRANSVVQLDKLSGDPVDIYVEKQQLGKGEVLVLQEKLRIRVIEITPVTRASGEDALDRTKEK